MTLGTILAYFQNKIFPTLKKILFHVAISLHILYWSDETAYYEKYPPWRRRLHGAVMHRNFEIAISIMIGVNILLMATEHYNQPYVS